MRRAQLGSISTGTTSAEDLIPTLLAELETIDVGGEFQELANDAADLQDYGSDQAHCVLNALVGALNEFAPANCFFGTRGSDVADYGFWPLEPPAKLPTV